MRSAATSALAALVVLIVLLPAACSRKEIATPPTLIEAGAEPRSRFEVAGTGATQRVAIEIRTAIGLMQGDRLHEDKSIPPVRVVIAIGGNGDVDGATRFRIESVALAGEASDAELQQMWVEDLGKHDAAGRSGHFVRDRHGRVTAVELDIPPRAPANLQQLLRSVKSLFALALVPSPEQDLGTGARHRDVTTIDFSGMRLDLDATYELLERDDRGTSFGIEASLHALPQPLELPAQKDTKKPQGRAELLAADAKCKGRVTMRAGLPFPVEGRLEIPLQMDVRTLHQNVEQRVRSTVGIDYRIAAADSPSEK
jgi:hypothetical protein